MPHEHTMGLTIRIGAQANATLTSTTLNEEMTYLKLENHERWRRGNWGRGGGIDLAFDHFMVENEIHFAYMFIK